MLFADFTDTMESRGFLVELSRRDELDPTQLAESYPDLVDLEPGELVLWVMDGEVPGLVVNYWKRPPLSVPVWEIAHDFIDKATAGE